MALSVSYADFFLFLMLISAVFVVLAPSSLANPPEEMCSIFLNIFISSVFIPAAWQWFYQPQSLTDTYWLQQ